MQVLNFIYGYVFAGLGLPVSISRMSILLNLGSLKNHNSSYLCFFFAIERSTLEVQFFWTIF